LIPRLEGSRSGFTFKFWKQSSWEDLEFRSAFIHLTLFHLFLIIAIICFSRTIYSNPGYLNNQYIEIYSIINFIKIFFEYLLKYNEKNYKLSIMSNSSNILDDIKCILESKKLIKKLISEYKESYL
jgi:hypothetical protein